MICIPKVKNELTERKYFLGEKYRENYLFLIFWPFNKQFLVLSANFVSNQTHFPNSLRKFIQVRLCWCWLDVRIHVSRQCLREPGPHKMWIRSINWMYNKKLLSTEKVESSHQIRVNNKQVTL